ncbi:MAG: periplasmic heavy metal sensor [Pseudomonadota bacterium]
MKNCNFAKTLMAITIAVVLGFGSTAFAGPGMGYGRGGYGPGMGYGPQMMGPGYGMGPGMMGYGPGMGRGFRGYGNPGDLKDEDLKKLDEQRNAFFEATKDLQNGLYEKSFELRSELAKQSPDSQKAGKLQKEISELKTQLDQKRIEHMIEMKKINPNVGRGFAGRGPGGYGAGFGGACRR